MQATRAAVAPKYAFYLPKFVDEKHARDFAFKIEAAMPDITRIEVMPHGFVLLSSFDTSLDTVAVEHRLLAWFKQTM